jgi:hypothetical protein
LKWLYLGPVARKITQSPFNRHTLLLVSIPLTVPHAILFPAALLLGQPKKVFGLDTDDLRNDSAQESIEFAGDDDNRNPYRVDDVPCVDSAELTDEVLQSERQR